MAGEREVNLGNLTQLERYKELLKQEKGASKTWKGKLDANEVEMVELHERQKIDAKIVKQADYRVKHVE